MSAAVPATVPLEDYVAIEQLYARYAFAVDLRDIDGWVGCFTSDGELGRTGGPMTSGHEALRAMGAVITASAAASGYHWNANLVITPSADGARGRCYFMLLKPGDGPAQATTVGHFEDELVHLGGQWLFRRRTMHSLDSALATATGGDRSATTTQDRE